VLLYSELDPGLEEAICTIIWVAPRLSADVQELKEVCVLLLLCTHKVLPVFCQRVTIILLCGRETWTLSKRASDVTHRQILSIDQI